MTAQQRRDSISTGKTVLVTGASRGIGRACALACAGSGADVIVGVRKPADGAALVAEIEALGRRALAVRDGPRRPVKRCAPRSPRRTQQFGRIDVLVNNVGIGPENLAENVTEEDFDFTVDINLKGTFFTTQAVARLMIAQKSGRIINISSQAGSVDAQGRGDLLHDQGGDQSPDALPRRRMGAARHHRQQRRADLHLDRRHAPEPRRSGIPRACARPYPARPHRRPDRRGRNGGVPGLARRVADHRRQYSWSTAAGRWRDG